MPGGQVTVTIDYFNIITDVNGTISNVTVEGRWKYLNFWTFFWKQLMSLCL